MMPLVTQILALVAAALHVLFFYLESVVFSKPSTWKRFGVESQQAADHVRPMALNQGFYNLFLAAGVVLGVVWQFATTEVPTAHGDSEGMLFIVRSGHLTPQWTSGVIIFGLLCMLAASIVLLVSSRGKLLRAALIQGLAPAIALLVIVLS